MQHHQNGAGPPSASNMSLLNSGPILNAGQQADMTTLYNIVDALSKQLADNRAETARLIEAAHRLALHKADEASSPPDDSTSQATLAQLKSENARLKDELASKDRLIGNQREQDVLNWKLIRDFEKGIEQILNVSRPHAHNQAQYVLSLQRHYNDLIQKERDEKLQLTLEYQNLQAGLGRVADWNRLALKEHSESSQKWVRRITGLKTENRLLRQLANVDQGWESDEDPDEEVAAAERSAAYPPEREKEQGE